MKITAQDLLGLKVIDGIIAEPVGGAHREPGAAIDATGRQIAAAFEEHDLKLLGDSYALRNDRDAYIGFVRQSTEMLDQVMQADRERQEPARVRNKAAE